MSNKYPQASPCGGVIFYRWDNSQLTIYISERRNADGSASGQHSFYGGFAECGDYLKNPVGTVQDKRIEIYRECVEEMGSGFAKIVSQSDFINRCEPVASLMVRTDDSNKIHDATFVAYFVEEPLAHYLEKQAKPTDEQLPAKPYKFGFSTSYRKKPLLEPYDGHELLQHLHVPKNIQFFHQHEANAMALFFYNKGLRA
ncbi:MAG: hypothetical protein CMF60_06440 [Magnetococcales bacterium]|nr:hypothetical protein [Magnetococcales bacterium]|tara:strand:+ start:58595 stop:59191 length:597 start_codon:yes stop_codon:yes gene_type:complete